MKTYIYRFLISLLIIFSSFNSVFASTYVSLSPVFTEIIYTINAEHNLLGVSALCNYPEEAKLKPIIGDSYFVNTEMIVKLKPDYLFAMESAKPKLGELSLTQTKPIYFDFKNIEDIYSAIKKIGNITGNEKNAESTIADIKNKIEINKTNNPKRILYLVQTNPIITIGKESFITDMIEKSGHISVTSDIKYYYPEITMEYAMKQKPDVIILCFPSDVSQVEKLFPNTKILYLNDIERDKITRPGPRVWEGIKLFSDLAFSDKPQ